MTDLIALARRLDERHDQARTAHLRGDVDGYMQMFAPELTYLEPGGRKVDYATLKRRTKIGLRRVNHGPSSYRREALTFANKEATETLHQTAELHVVAYGLIRRDLVLERELRYTWREMDREWLITAIQVLSERWVSSRWSFAWQRPKSA
jgi:hypothetical protein